MPLFKRARWVSQCKHRRTGQRPKPTTRGHDLAASHRRRSFAENQRQLDDPSYAELLARVRSGKAIPSTDHATLSSRILSRLATTDPSAFDRFSDAPVIVGLRTVRDDANEILLHQAALKLNVPVIKYFSDDKIRGDLPDAAQARVWKLPSTTTGDCFGILPLFCGMRVMITENLAISNRLVNGAEGIVKHVDYEIDEQNRRYAKACYVLVKGSGVQIRGFEPDVVPILPVQASFSFKPPFGDQFYISRLQLPLVPAYSYTDYKSQGRTLKTAIVDLKSARSLQGIYVMLSRVKSLDGLAVLGEFPRTLLEQNLSEELRTEFARLTALDRETQSAYASLLHDETEEEPMEF